MLFLRLHAGWDKRALSTPAVQPLICLRGSVGLMASGGTARDIGPGDVWPMADNHGKGRLTGVSSVSELECVMGQHR